MFNLDYFGTGKKKSSGSSWFSSFRFSKPSNLVKPYLHYIEKNQINRLLQSRINNPNIYNLLYPLVSNYTRMSVNELHVACNKMFMTLPKSFAEDVFNCYYTKMRDLEFAKRTSTNTPRYSMLEKVSDPYVKILTERNGLKSMLFTESKMIYVILLLALIKEKDQKQLQELMDAMSEESEDGEKEDGKGKSEKKDDQKEGGKDDEENKEEGKDEGGETKDSDQKSNQTSNGKSEKSEDGPETDDSKSDKGSDEENSDEESSEEGDKNSDGSSSTKDKGKPDPNGQTEPSQKQELTDEDTDDNIGENSNGDEFEETPSEFDQIEDPDLKEPSKALEAILSELFSVDVSLLLGSLEKALDEDVKKKLEFVNDVMDNEEQEKAWNRDASEAYDMISTGDIKLLKEEFTAINMNIQPLVKCIRNILDKSKAYFSGKEKVIYEGIWDTDNLAGMQDFELLHPKMKNLFLDDIMIKNVEYVGKVNLYVDISGSMSDRCGFAGLTKLQFAKSMIVKMKELNILNKIYVFENQVYELKDTLFSILQLAPQGGTDINRCVLHIIDQDENAIILTDAEDGCHYYTEKAFFVGVKGSNFRGFDHDIIKQYSENKQVIVFNGKEIHNVDKVGNPY